MAFASFDSKRAGAPMAEINMVPLIDVMLVLLVIFIVTAPLLTQAVKLDLPKASSQVNDLRPEKIEFAIDAAGTLFWNGEPVDRARRPASASPPKASKTPQPEVHLRADQAVAYRFVAQTLADASQGRADQGRLHQRAGREVTRGGRRPSPQPSPASGTGGDSFRSRERQRGHLAALPPRERAGVRVPR